MKHLPVSLNANKSFLNVQKTELLTFKQKWKILHHEIKIKLNRKRRLYITPSVNYLGLKTAANLNWHHHINDQSAKFNRANALLLTSYVNQKVIKSIYFAIFDSHPNYANLIWAQNSNAIQRITMLQKNPLE